MILHQETHAISIHALAKRATIRLMSAERNSFYFNPRPRKEGDDTVNERREKLILFQSTPSQRGRPPDSISVSGGKRFQSTPSQRGRLNHLAKVKLTFLISIHALAKRATSAKTWQYNTRLISIHALAKRATANLYNDYLYFEAKYHISDIFPL